MTADITDPAFRDVAVWATGWMIGWVLLWRPRELPLIAAAPARDSIAVVIPARNEAAAIATVVGAFVPQLRPGDHLIVVDDHSSDDTRIIAERSGATVVDAPPLAAGWLGKPNACWHGACSTVSEVLVFVDADVHPAPDLLDRLVAQLALSAAPVVSIQPWHTTGRFVEQASILSNVTALMGTGAFTIASRRQHARVAFGPVLAMRRSTYAAVGGHANESVRAAHTEDIALTRAAGGAQLFVGRLGDTTFRMYPDGLRQTIDGWTRSIATGARYTTWWAALGVLAWIWSLAGGWITAPIVYPLSALQVWVLGRRAGSVRPLTALLYPIAVVVFVVIFLRSLIRLGFGRNNTWKDRSVRARPG